MSKATTPAGAPVTDQGGRPRVDPRTGRPIIGDGPTHRAEDKGDE